MFDFAIAPDLDDFFLLYGVPPDAAVFVRDLGIVTGYEKKLELEAMTYQKLSVKAWT